MKGRARRRGKSVDRVPVAYGGVNPTQILSLEKDDHALMRLVDRRRGLCSIVRSGAISRWHEIPWFLRPGRPPQTEPAATSEEVGPAALRGVDGDNGSQPVGRPEMDFSHRIAAEADRGSSAIAGTGRISAGKTPPICDRRSSTANEAGTVQHKRKP